MAVDDTLSASKLQIALSRAIRDRANTSQLPLPLTRLLGTVAVPVVDDSKPVNEVRRPPVSELPLPLSREISKQPVASQLPLPLTRLLGTVEAPAPDVKRTMKGVAACFIASNSRAGSIGLCRDYHARGAGVASCLNADYAVSLHIERCYDLLAKGFTPVANCSKTSGVLSQTIQSCLRNYWHNFRHISNCKNASATASVNYQSCSRSYTQSAIARHHCDNNVTLEPSTLNHCLDAINKGIHIKQCHSTYISKSVPVPCRYYPIPELPPLPPSNPLCKLRPPSNRLPLPLTRLRQGLPSNALPINLTCWHDEPVKTIPNLTTYIMQNIITATLGGISIEPLSFDIKTDMNSYCWSGSVAISDSDYKKVKTKLEQPKGSEPIITVVINGTSFSIIAEELSRSRKFANYSYTLSGRSITARLGEDYALPQSGLLDQGNYASQIVNQQLANLLINVQDFDIADWLIPANQYAVTGKTPIAIIQEIAAACGGFVETHKSQPTLSLRKRWKVAAWELATATPDVILPFDIPRQVNDKKTISTRYNTATLVSDIEAGNVYRQTQSRDSAAPIMNNALYTDRDCIVPAGTAILSDSGIHQHYTISMMWSPKYNVELAKLGDVWQFNDEDEDGAWRGIVQSVGVNVSLENNAPVVLQTVTIDRYLDV